MAEEDLDEAGVVNVAAALDDGDVDDDAADREGVALATAAGDKDRRDLDLLTFPALGSSSTSSSSSFTESREYLFLGFSKKSEG